MGFAIENGVLIKYHKENGVNNADIPAGVKSIGKQAFSKQKRLAEITLPEGVTHIGREAFAHCTSLQRIALPSTLTVMEPEAFSGCIRLQEIVLPRGVRMLPEKLFFGCTALISVTLPEGLEEIGVLAFGRCRRLVQLRLPEGLRIIGDKAFHDCRSLSGLEIPGTVTQVGKDSLTRTGMLLDAQKEYFTIGQGMLYRYLGHAEEVRIPAYIRQIMSGAFGDSVRNCAILLPDTLERIDEGAFTARQRIRLCHGDVCVPLTYYAGSRTQELENRRLLQLMTQPEIAARAEIFSQMRTADYKIPAAAFMAASYDCDPYKAYLHHMGKRAAEYFIRLDDAGTLTQILPFLNITKRNVDGLIELAIAQESRGCQDILLHHKGHAVGYQEAADYFKL